MIYLKPSSNISEIDCGTSSPKLQGVIDLLGFPNLVNFYCVNNNIEAFTGYENLFSIRNLHVNRNLLAGNLQNINFLLNLRDFRVSNNFFTGNLPSLSSNIFLQYFRGQDNQFTGSIPSLSLNSNLIEFWCQNNQLTGFVGGSVSNTLGNFQAQNNQLSTTAVNDILAAFVAANRTTGTRILNLGGTGNATPTGQGLVDKQTLINRGWTVTTN